MAFVNRIGNILKQSVSRHTSLELSASRTTLYQAIRSMSSSKLFIGGLSYGTDESSLREAFSQYGEVIEARVILDRDTGRSRGFGFISFPSSEEATSALHAMDGQDLHGRQVRVNYATEKRRDGFGGGYGSSGNPNYGGGGGNFARGGGYATSNYGGGGGGFSASNNFAGGDGGYSGGGNYGTNNSSPASNYGGGAGYGGGNYGSTPGSNYSGQGSSFGSGYGDGNSGNYYAGASSRGDGFTNTEFGGSSRTPYNGGQEQLDADQGTESVNEDIRLDVSEGSYRDDDDEPSDYANTRG